MRHSIAAENYGVRLRPVRLNDAAFIVWLRNLDHVRGKVGDSAMDSTSQVEWLEEYFQRTGDYYFLIETACGIPVGTYGLYNIGGGEGESGRWIVRPEVPAGIPSILLGFQVAFERLNLQRLLAHTVSTNERVLSLNRKLGFRPTKEMPVPQIIDGKRSLLIQFEFSAERWPQTREMLAPMARVAEENIRAWERNFVPPG